MAASKINPSISRADFWLRTGILLLAIVLRLWGIRFGLPYLYHADEPIVVNHALQYGSGEFNPHFFNIPPLTSYLLFFIYGLIFLLGKGVGFWQTSTGFAQYFFQDPTFFYVTARILLGALPAVLSVALLMRWSVLAGFSRLWGQIAGLLLTVCFIHVSDAHYVYADMPLVLISILFFLILYQTDLSLKHAHFQLGLIIGLAAAFKYNGIFLALPYLWMLVGSPKKNIFLFIRGGFAALGCGVAFCVLNPYAILDYSFFLRELQEQSIANTGVPFWHHLTYSFAEGMGWPLVILGLLGIVRALGMRNAKFASVAFFCVVYYLVLWQKGQPYGRYILPLVPFIIFLAVEISRYLWDRRSRVLKTTVVVLLIWSFTGNLVKSVRFDWIMHRSDVRTQAAQWIEKNIPSGSRIALDGTSFTPRLSFSCQQLAEKLVSASPANRLKIQNLIQSCGQKPSFELFFLADQPGQNPFLFGKPELKRDRDALLKNKIRYLVLIPEIHGGMKGYEPLGKLGVPLKVWESRPDQSSESEVFDTQIITGGPFTTKDLLARTSNGYRIELYRLGADTLDR